MRNKLFAFLLLVSQMVLWGCYLEGPEYTEELDLVYTNYHDQFDFQSRGTYAMPDSVVKITGEIGAPEYLNFVYGAAITQAIAANMTALGWQRVHKDASPDVQLLPAAWSTTTLVGGYWGGYYCWWYPYYCGGGWYYPYYPVTSYTTGTLVMTMVDANSLATDSSKTVVWTGAINGLLGYSYDIDRITNAINQSFNQSPYLKTN